MPTREEIAAAARDVLADREVQWAAAGDEADEDTRFARRVRLCARVALEAMEAPANRTSCAKCGAWTHKPVHINLPTPIKCNGAFTVEDIRRPTGDK